MFIDLHEMQISGMAVVLAVREAPEIKAGKGRLVTSTFKHLTRKLIVEIGVEGTSEKIYATGNHPFWSESRQKWIPAAKLIEGDILRTLKGSTKVTKVSETHRKEIVYNIEVEGDHVYRVGKLGLLVHNSCLLALKTKMSTFRKSGVDKDGNVIKGLKGHYDDHGVNVGATSQVEYLKMAKEMANSTDPKLLVKVINNQILKADPEKGLIYVGNWSKKKIKSFYKNMDYDTFEEAWESAIENAGKL